MTGCGLADRTWVYNVDINSVFRTNRCQSCFCSTSILYGHRIIYRFCVHTNSIKKEEYQQ